MELISRDDVIEAIKLYFTDIISNMPCDNKHNIIDTALAENYLEANKGLIGKIRELPTIEEREEGRWIPFLPEYKDMFECTKCKAIVRLAFKATRMPYKYCPYCGKEMKGE
jgi:hypothetical protein